MGTIAFIIVNKITFCFCSLFSIFFLYSSSSINLFDRFQITVRVEPEVKSYDSSQFFHPDFDVLEEKKKQYIKKQESSCEKRENLIVKGDLLL